MISSSVSLNPELGSWVPGLTHCSWSPGTSLKCPPSKEGNDWTAPPSRLFCGPPLPRAGPLQAGPHWQDALWVMQGSSGLTRVGMALRARTPELTLLLH